MEVLECIDSRRSIRKYDKKDVPNELIAQIITAGTHAPSSGNIQPWEFIIVRDKKKKKELATAALRQEQIEEAPVVIIVCANKDKSGLRYGDRGRNLYSIQDTAACTENMLLAITALGLGANWIGAFEEDAVSSIVKLPEKLRPVAIISIGFPLPYEEPMETSRIPFENLTWEEEYGKKLSWMMGYGKESRFKLEPLDQQVRKQIKKLKEKIEEPKEKKPEKKKEDYPKRLIKFIKNLPK